MAATCEAADKPFRNVREKDKAKNLAACDYQVAGHLIMFLDRALQIAGSLLLAVPLIA